MSRILSFFALFTSVSTLICCALPALLVSLGLGAVMAGLVSHVPGLIWLSENKLMVFLTAGFILCVNGALMWYRRNAPCPIEPRLRDACLRGRRFSKVIYLLSLLVFSVGIFFAYLAPELL